MGKIVEYVGTWDTSDGGQRWLQEATEDVK